MFDFQFFLLTKIPRAGKENVFLEKSAYLHEFGFSGIGMHFKINKKKYLISKSYCTKVAAVLCSAEWQKIGRRGKMK